MAYGHRGSGPKRNGPTDVKWMADQAVWQRRAEREANVKPTLEVQPHLSDSKQIQVINRQTDQWHKQPTRRKERDQRPFAERAGDVPNRDVDRSPKPDERDQRET